MLLSLDPSSTCTGYAVFDGPDKLVDGGLLNPSERLSPLQRITDMCQELDDIASDFSIDRCVIEITTGKVSTRHKGSGAGLGIYGFAVGVIYERARSLFDGKIDAIRENVWTAGTKKHNRQLAATMRFPGYDPDKDKGMDLSDAIALGIWWYDRQFLNQL